MEGIRSFLGCGDGLTPLSNRIWGAADDSIATEVSSVSSPSEVAAFVVDLPQGVILAHPAGTEEQVLSDTSAEYSANVPPAAITDKALAHL